MFPAKADHLAVHQHELDAEDIVRGNSVFETVYPARVLGDVAADCAGDLARWVRCVVEPGVLHGLGDRQIGDTWLGDDAAVVVINVQNAIELGHAEQYAVGERQRAAGERGAGAARYDFDAGFLAIAQHRRDLLDAGRQSDDQRRLAVGCQPVALIGPALRS